MRRWLFGALGVLFVGLAVLGALLPGLPTTIFLIGATWCFARSFPELSDRLLEMRIFRPFRAWLVPGGTVSRRSKITALLMMWAAITFTVHLALRGEAPNWILAVVVVLLGFIGTFFIVRHGRRRSGLESDPAVRGVEEVAPDQLRDDEEARAQRREPSHEKPRSQ